MGRPLRHVHPGGSHFEITTRALQSRFLLPAGKYFRSLAIGIIARAKERYSIELYAFGGLSNHLHLLVGAQEVDQLAGFVGYVKSNLAREAGRIVDWSETFWGDRYHAIEISDEEEIWIDRLRYLLSHGPKENLVLRCRDWPGLQCVEALTEGKALEGIWLDRSRECTKSRYGKESEPEAYIQDYTLKLDPPPCWRHLSQQEVQSRMAEIVAEVDSETARRVVLNGRLPLGVEAVLKQHPHDRPIRTKKSPAPRVHAASKAIRELMIEAYRLFVESYREAALRLRMGELAVEFPPGCFPPPRRFVAAGILLSSIRAGPSVDIV